MTTKPPRKRPTYIETTYGRRCLVRRFGIVGEFALTTPTPAAPNGETWVFNEQRGWVPVPSNGRAVRQAWARESGIGPTTE